MIRSHHTRRVFPILLALVQLPLTGISGCPATYFRDADLDSFGDPQDTLESSSGAPAGYVEDNTDCDDSSPTAAYTWPGAASKDSSSACMKDFDLDGFGDNSPSTGVTAGYDCDDEDATLNPYAADLPGDQIDNNCSGAIDESFRPGARIAAGANHSMTIDAYGHVWTAGSNYYGQLGDGSTTDSSVPIQVMGLEHITGVAGGYGHSMALDSTGQLWAWGLNSSGQLGNGSQEEIVSVPVKVVKLQGVVAIAGGGIHSLALDNQGRVWAWGYNSKGQLGNGTTRSSSIPIQVSGIGGSVAIAAGYEHSLAADNQGRIWAWGDNYAGQIGNGTTTSSSLPVQILQLSGGVAVAAGENHSLALDTQGQVWAWGLNLSGQLGNGTESSSKTPVEVIALEAITTIAAGENHSLAIDTDGRAWSWGLNNLGQLGDGTRVASPRATSKQEAIVHLHLVLVSASRLLCRSRPVPFPSLILPLSVRRCWIPSRSFARKRFVVANRIDTTEA